MSLITDLTSVPQREHGGSTALERFDFQTAWGLAHLLKLHESGDDYAIAFEFHDDIVVLDNATSPTRARFFQLKTAASGNWTVKKLTTGKKKRNSTEKDPSIAVKMFDSRDKFGASAEHLGFVSNQPCNFIDQNKYPCSFFEADKDEFKAFVEAVKKDIPTFTTDDAKLFQYHYADLSLDNYEDILLGRMVNFIASHCNLNECNHKGFYLSVLDQCRKKSKYLKEITCFDELKKAKMVTRSNMEAWLGDLMIRTKSRPQWNTILSELYNLSPLEKRALKQEWDRYELANMTTANLAIAKLRNGIRDVIDSIALGNANGPPLPMDALLEIALPELKALAKKLSNPVSDNYLKAAFLYEFYGT